MWFLALFLPPVYLFMRGRIFAGIINSILCVVGLLTIPIMGIGLFFLFCAVVQSLMTYSKIERTKVINEQAEAIATKMAEKMQNG
jgi:hypothetical protein